ncbi:hypothetical protein DFH09DRAFT_1353922 [Mycena vulgaris]|nr:hypothetical protein DFH09DRAFT_1353922 [Mycena vulgaris]
MLPAATDEQVSDEEGTVTSARRPRSHRSHIHEARRYDGARAGRCPTRTGLGGWASRVRGLEPRRRPAVLDVRAAGGMRHVWMRVAARDDLSPPASLCVLLPYAAFVSDTASVVRRGRSHPAGTPRVTRYVVIAPDLARVWRYPVSLSRAPSFLLGKEGAGPANLGVMRRALLWPTVGFVRKPLITSCLRSSACVYACFPVLHAFFSAAPVLSL